MLYLNMVTCVLLSAWAFVYSYLVVIKTFPAHCVCWYFRSNDKISLDIFVTSVKLPKNYNNCNYVSLKTPTTSWHTYSHANRYLYLHTSGFVCMPVLHMCKMSPAPLSIHSFKHLLSVQLFSTSLIVILCDVVVVVAVVSWFYCFTFSIF